MKKPKILAILGSTREGRYGEKAFQWAKNQLVDNFQADIEWIDLKDWKLDYYNEPFPAMMLKEKGYTDPKAKEWAEKVGSADAYLLFTPEYNHSFPAVLKNALDLTYKDWNNKPVAFVSWGGSAGGSRAVEQLRLVAVELQMAPIREGVHILLFDGGADENGLPIEKYNTKLDNTFNQLLWWTKALKNAREEKVTVTSPPVFA